jgi:rubrerythrin
MAEVLKVGKKKNVIVDEWQCGDCGEFMYSNGAPDYCQHCGEEFTEIDEG